MPRPARVAPVGGDLDDQIGLEMVVHLAGAQVDRAAFALEIAAHALDATIGADAGDLHAAGGREQIGHIVPHLEVDIIAIGILEVADGFLVAQRLDAAGQSGEARPGRACRRHIGAKRCRLADFFGLEMIGDERDFGLPAAPAGLIGAKQLRREDLAGDLPHAVAADIDAFENAALPARLAAEGAAHRERMPAGPGGVAVGAERDDGREEIGRVDGARRQAVRALADHPAEIGEDVGLPMKLVVAMLEQRIIGEKRGGALPLALIHIVRPGEHDALHIAHALHAVDIAGQRGEPVCRRRLCRCKLGQRQQRQTQHRRPKAAQHRRQRLPLHASHQNIRRLMSQWMERNGRRPELVETPPPP